MAKQLPHFYAISEEVQDALHERRPIVGLESSVVTGGSRPFNYDTAKAAEQVLRDAGAVPARIAILHGRLLIGVNDAELDELASGKVRGKASTRDLAYVLAARESAGTTVSSSLVACAQVGIETFSVAGIGGVHYEAQQTFDISPDLIQFARTRVAVVCAGAKSMLDPALTLEVLETLGIPVVGYRWSDFPGYYTQSTTQTVPVRLDELSDIASLVRTHWALDGAGAVLITHPIEKEFSIDNAILDPLIRDAIAQCKAQGITGQAVTPAILKIIAAATDGKSNLINRAVLLSTARVAAEFAGVLARSRVDHA
ncbi:pseudouridine-5'-phosphate glycosidase [Burkholderia stagnalis]|uniref:Pseudouridine-5'-phosphate glycosidase n=1 Tax=Burkholderia stagnalis TaxID=1503054 RepID=A0ABX9YK78_9BURK|nr:pseudouridine-5'-phosphate glycosidase [Burkholderia stagnalis]AOK54564.1 hypothetical protein WT74_17105 [Burkholderia stagnalis]KVN29933.1 hypothetical protein WT11_24260 [Burkholderia stagnalis]KWO32267.1 hypothetical protein WT95_14925 [Burkholderia stagnalis]KWO40976.1 hypothetical protein WT96_00070 [Burkholderia stagnalis]MDY7805515.1 pseudouridine-5'-phosphate glycosidase [Burkholderia stagnalis]